MYEHLILQDQVNIRHLTLNNPKRLNALHSGLLGELEAALIDTASKTTLRGVLLSGSGGRAFAAGADIQEFTQLNPETAQALASRGQAIFDRLAQLPIPVIAAVEGYALGGGCELALACHMRIAAENAVFGQPEVSLGLIPGYGGTQRLADCVGRASAIEWILTGRQVTAKEALEAGLVSQVVPVDTLLDAALSILQSIAQQPPFATRMALHAIQSRSYAQEASAFALCANHPEGQAGVQAFLQKRR